MAHVNAEKSEVSEDPSAGAIAHPRPAPLSSEVHRCVEVIRRLEACRDQPSYGAERQRAMQALGVSERSLRRLQQQYRDRGVEGLKRQSRSDEGQSKVDESWRKFILETYRKGNRGTRQMSRAQVAKQVESHAAELGTADYPSRRTVYRIKSMQNSECKMQNDLERLFGFENNGGEDFDEFIILLNQRVES